MSGVRTWARRRDAFREDVPRTGRQVRRELSLASGAMQGETQDPVSGVTENFRLTFDRVGQSRARALTEAVDQTEQTEAAGRNKMDGQVRAQRPGGAEQIGESPERTGRVPGVPGGAVMPDWGAPLQKFSETAFRRGVLSASVLGGTGKLMLVSCLKRSVEYGKPNMRMERGLFDAGGQTRNVPGRSPDKMVFRRGFVGSAVGLVVDTLKDARQSVESMRDMALGAGELDGERNTVARMYPFLDDSRERELYADYESRLAVCTDVRERAALQNGLVHVRALIDRKASMKEAFVGKLREVSEKAEQALEEFEAPGFEEEVYQAVIEPEMDELPPPDDDGDAPPDDDGEVPPDDSADAENGGEVPPMGGENKDDNESPEDEAPPEDEEIDAADEAVPAGESGTVEAPPDGTGAGGTEA